MCTILQYNRERCVCDLGVISNRPPALLHTERHCVRLIFTILCILVTFKVCTLGGLIHNQLPSTMTFRAVLFIAVFVALSVAVHAQSNGKPQPGHERGRCHCLVLSTAAIDNSGIIISDVILGLVLLAFCVAFIVAACCIMRDAVATRRHSIQFNSI